MVVSKDSKRKRKESPPPQPPMVESSPEMPKRTKVQAQRKFAQGQSAPTTTTTYASSALAASSSSTIGGPSASSESREPPTEILPNKRPKTEDFLTFLCFRGTSALPAHLDFLNQGKTNDSEKRSEKKKTKIAKTTSKKPTKAKKGRKKGKAIKGRVKKEDDEPVASTSAAAAAALLAANNATETEKNNVPSMGELKIDPHNEEKEYNAKTNADELCSSHNKLEEEEEEEEAKQKYESNRQNRAAEDEKSDKEEKSSKSLEVKRRSNRTNVKDIVKIVTGNERNDDDDGGEDDHYSANNKTEHRVEFEDDESTKKSRITPIQSASPTKESDSSVSKGQRGGGKMNIGSLKKPIAGTADSVEQKYKSKDTNSSMQKAEKLPNKTKQIKRPRQKESPIFIPSPEPTGRMTRQRAFFEPVKVPPSEPMGAADSSVQSEEQNRDEEVKSPLKVENEILDISRNETVIKIGKKKKAGSLKNVTTVVVDESKTDEKTNSLNVFDFSSDDEQPLSKAIKFQKRKIQEPSIPKKGTTSSKRKGKKGTKKMSQETAASVELKNRDEGDDDEKKKCETDKNISIKEVPVAGNKNKRISSKNLKKEQKNIKDDDESSPPNDKNIELMTATVAAAVITDDNSIVPSPIIKKAMSNTRHQRKINQIKAEQTTSNGRSQTEESDSLPHKSQRPSRKTKEAAAIYMGIIGHKLQQDDEDDNLSLNSFPDLPNVKEMEKMEFELKKNAVTITAAAAATTTTATINTKPSTKSTAIAVETEKQVSSVGGRRGRPPKQGKPPPPAKREIEGMLIKKGALATRVITASVDIDKGKVKLVKQESSKADSEDEDFLLSEEVKETKRKLERSFSDSDDEPLAVKVNVKLSDKDLENDSRKSDYDQSSNMKTSCLPTIVGGKQLNTPLLTSNNASANVSSSILTVPASRISSNSHSNFLKAAEKKSPIPNAKILNVPAAYGLPTTIAPNSNPFISKMEHKLISSNLTSSYLPPASPHYHTSNQARPSPNIASQTAKSPTQPPPPSHIAAPPPPTQSPLKYQQTPSTTTYPPPIEAYPSPKINPNFLTPKFDRSALPRTNNFPSPSPVKFDLSSTTSKTGGGGGGVVGNSTLSPKTLQNLSAVTPGTVHPAALPNTSSAGAVATGTNSDPLKDEIGSILAANLMPSKEESGKIFGIASVSLAQSSGPDNTKCTLGKCGSIHKPVLGPVVPTEGYIGDQLSSKERRKAKVNMTHEQIQKWLIECSSNPDDIQDDMDDDYDDNLRPNLFATTPPPTRDDKESTSFSSSSKATRDLGKSESAWSGKGPSLKAIPVVAATSQIDEAAKSDFVVMQHLQPGAGNGNEVALQLHGNLTTKATANAKTNANNVEINNKSIKEKNLEKKLDKKLRDEKLTKDINSKDKEPKLTKNDKEKESYAFASVNANKTAAAGKQSTSTLVQATSTIVESTISTTSKTNRKKTPIASTVPSGVREEKMTPQKSTIAPHPSNTSATTTTKRTPVYNQKASTQKSVELKETTTTSHKKKSPFSYNFGAFSVENEKSIYSFDRDDEDNDDDVGVGNKIISKPTLSRQGQRASHHSADIAPSTPTTPTPTPPLRSSSSKKRNAIAVLPPVDKANNKDNVNASQSNSVSLTLSPGENCKLVKVSLEAEQQTSVSATKAKSGKLKSKLNASAPTAPTASQTQSVAEAAAADSDSDGHTFYIPLQGTGSGGSVEGGIQGVAVKLGREGPEGPNQKVIMHATLVTKAQMGQNSKPLPDSMNASEIVKNLLITSASSGTETEIKKCTPASTSPPAIVSTSAAAANNSASNSLKSVPVGTVQPRFKGLVDPAGTTTTTTTSTTTTAPQPSTSMAAGGSALVRVNSNSSLFSGSAKSRHGAAAGSANISSNANKKFKDDTPIKMSNNTAFPRHDDPTQMVEAPIFRPTEKEFSDPIDFIERITPIAARFGICKIVPPSTFKPECRISDEMRFTAYNQYVHKMLHRWGPSAKELSAIKKYLATQSIVMNHPPWIGGMEVDLPRLYHTVQELGGLKEVIEKKKWARVAEEMCIPKLAQDRVTKLDDIYCKYLLPYDTLSPGERQKLFDEVEADWAKREARARRNADRFVNTESVSNEEDDVSSDDDEESEEEVDGVSMECIVKGRSMPLSQFYRIARNTMTLWFKNTEPTVNEVEAEFWRHVAVRDSHVCVHSGSIDSSGWGYGFPQPGPKGKGSNYARHPWNLKVLTNNSGSVLRSLGPVMGVTVPTLHVGMLFSACCWYRDPHGLSWIEYLHTGASKLWYGIPDDQSANFRSALTSLIPTHCQNKTIWLPCDTVMVPPHMLTDRGVSLCRIEQKPGEFIVVFPRAYTSSLATGYVVSESVYFATSSWLDLAKDDFRDIHDSCEPAMFSLEQLLFALGSDQRVSPDTLQQMLPMLKEVFEKETAAREQLKAAGVTSSEKMSNEKSAKSRKQQPVKSVESECDLCRANLYISMVRTEEGNVYCLQHALKNLNNGNIQAKQCKLIYAYNIEDVENLIKNLNSKIQQKRITGNSNKKNNNNNNNK